MADTPKKAASQDDIDALIRDAQTKQGGPPPAPAPATARTPSVSLDDIDALIREAQAAQGGTVRTPAPAPAQAAAPAPAPAAKPAPTPAAPAAPAAPAINNATTASIAQSDIDDLLKEIQSATERQDVRKLSDHETKKFDKLLDSIQSAPAAATAGLTPTAIDHLVAKHAPGPGDQSARETMISQEDIDALVQQLSVAVGGEAPPADAPAPGDTAKRSATPAALAATMITAPTATVVTSASGAGMPAGAGSYPVLAPRELRGARGLLVAAVVLLAMCALAMGAVARGVSGLSRELLKRNDADPHAADELALELTAARSMLASSDLIEAATGVERLRQLKARYPDRATELAIELARHWRAHDQHRKAADEFASVLDRVLATRGDPRILLDHADSLARTDEVSGALRLVYALLASEAAYTDPADPLGHTRPVEEVERDRLAMQRAYLLLGDLLDRSDARLAVGASPADGHAPPEAAHDAHDTHDAHAAPAAHAGHHP